MGNEAWLLKYGCSLQGKTVAITGATGGLGREICRGVLFLGGSLLLLNRSESKTRELIKMLSAEYPQANMAFFPLNLEDMNSVKAAAEYLKQHTPDILLHNAGIYDVPRHLCSTGLDNVFQVNFASPYYLTMELLPQLRQHHSRVTVVGSIAHTYSKTDPEDPDFHTREACHLAYGNSKRYLMFAFGELFREEPEVGFSIGHPGITLTNISNHYPAWLYPMIKPFLKLFFMKPEKACRGILYALLNPMENLTWAGPRFFNIWGNPSVKKLSTCHEEEQERIYALAQSMYQGMM